MTQFLDNVNLGVKSLQQEILCKGGVLSNGDVEITNNCNVAQENLEGKLLKKELFGLLSFDVSEKMDILIGLFSSFASEENKEDRISSRKSGPF